MTMITNYGKHRIAVENGYCTVSKNGRAWFVQHAKWLPIRAVFSLIAQGIEVGNYD